ncbi:ABC transporter ATP-binding protein [Bacillus timonensis]|nr:ABC transporter ATP-binding protein [Bacillus timonensis]
MLTVRNLHKTIEGERVLENISFSIGKGSIVGLVGRNGVGKTTLLRSLVGILDVDQGEILFEEKNVISHPEVKQHIVFIPDSDSAFNGYSVKEIVHLYETVYPKFDVQYFYEQLQRFKLPHNRKIRNFSRGMRAAFFMILAISTRASFIILDEPTNGLDAIVKRKILEFILEEVSEKNLSILISSHHLDELEKIADTIFMMKNGTIDSVITMDDTKMHFKKIQVVFKHDFPESLRSLSNIEVIKRIGRVQTILIKGNTEETVKLIEQEKPILIEELPMTLEDMFVSALGGDEIVY